MEPPSAPISPIMPPATAVVTGQRRGTSWKSSIACPGCGKTEHEEKRGDEQGGCGHKAEEPGDGDEEDDGEGGDSADEVCKAAAEYAGEAAGECGEYGKSVGGVPLEPGAGDHAVEHLYLRGFGSGVPVLYGATGVEDEGESLLGCSMKGRSAMSLRGFTGGTGYYGMGG